MQREKAVQIFQSAIESVQPAHLMQEHLVYHQGVLTICGQSIPREAFRQVYVIGAGKAAAAMATETEKILGDLISDGLITTKYGHALPTQKIKIREAAHPVPDEKCVAAVAETLQLLEKVTDQDIVICLISGGASALWCDIPPGATLSEVQTTFDLLIRSGAAIHEINTVRKHLSGIKGGQLIRHCRDAKVFSLIISDVPGDDLAVIASGPTVADTSTFQDAHAILAKYNLLKRLPQSVQKHMEQGRNGLIPDTPKSGDPLFQHTSNTVIGSNRVAVDAAAKKAKALGYQTHIISSLITGDAGKEATKLVNTAIQYKGEKPACIIQGGETTVQVTGGGKGGRNQHFALTALYELSKCDKSTAGNITILSGGTDGTDGPTDATGAVVDEETVHQAAQKNLDITTYLNNHNAYPFLELTGSLVITGPTQTNVMDIMIALIQ
ncbi:glycerate kinase [Paraflavitalea soli]|uniref:Glycerate kinase n=1 Tax=Paraflavitalea soli TaxID=2315862 RepID=A0A3B7MVD4_9BACT|nr:glycerate kinase [Paraflavitalea soli]AXY77343.1 glycerate kinase [Paraflavitalea soli]